MQDTVPSDRIVVLQGGWSLFGNGSAGEILLRLTYKAYVEDEVDELSEKVPTDTETSEDELSDLDELDATISEQRAKKCFNESDNESFMDVLAALLVSDEFRGIVTSETVNTKSSDAGTNTSTSQPNADTVGLAATDSGNSRGILH